jgi:GNAT superfamily N-acetyltransferase
MTTSAVVMSGHKVELGDGCPVEVWVESGDDEASVLVIDGHTIVGRATAIRSHKPGAAELTAWTNPLWRRRGIARVAVGALVEWGRRHDIRYLVGAVGEDDAVARSFLGRAGLIVACRTDGTIRRFALLVPAPVPVPVPAAETAPAPAPPPDVDASAFAQAAAAVEGGASLSEADRLYRSYVASAARHPSSHAA